MATTEMDINAETVKLAERMNELYELYRSRKVKREDADSLANIAGKHLKAVQINLANRVFGAGLEKDLERLTAPTNPALTVAPVAEQKQPSKPCAQAV